MRKRKQGTGLKILTPKQMLQRLPIALAQVKAVNNSESLLNEIRQIVYSLYQSKQITTGWPIKMSLYFFGDNFYKIKEISRFFLHRYWGATSFLEQILEYLRHNFPWDRLISRQTDNPWPFYSEDLNLPDYFLRGKWKTEFVKTIHRQERTSSEEKSDGFH